jgi:hypothetical protein
MTSVQVSLILLALGSVGCVGTRPANESAGTAAKGEWGEPVRQDDSTTVYQRTFAVRASHWEPGGMTNYFAEFEHSNVHVAEQGRTYFHMMVRDALKAPASDCKLSLHRTSDGETRSVGVNLGSYYYVDLNADGRIDMMHDNVLYKSYIINDGEMVEVRRTKDGGQNGSTSLDGSTRYVFADGRWTQSDIKDR